MAKELLKYIQGSEPKIRAFLIKIYENEEYKDVPKLSTLLRVLKDELFNSLRNSYVFDFLVTTQQANCVASQCFRYLSSSKL